MRISKPTILLFSLVYKTIRLHDYEYIVYIEYTSAILNYVVYEYEYTNYQIILIRYYNITR